jgi:hypothetical protein
LKTLTLKKIVEIIHIYLIFLAHKKIKDRQTAKSFEENVENLKGKKKELYLKKLQNTEAYLESLEGE